MEKILVVDDEVSVLEVCERALKSDGCSVSITYSGEDALSLLKIESFDLVLADINLPGITGIDLLKRIKSLSPQTEVMIITGEATVKTAVDALKNGAYDYILKPFSLAQLSLNVKKALEYSRLRRQERIFRETTYLYKLAQEIARPRTESELLNFILERTVKALHSDAGSIFILFRDRGLLAPMAVFGSRACDEIRMGEGIAGWVAEKRQPVLIQQNELNDIPQFKDLTQRLDVVSSMVVPLIDNEVLLGVICLNRFTNLTNYQFSCHDLESLKIFAFHATLILSALRHQQALGELGRLKSEFIANVSHELRTPLMAISGAMELLNNYIKPLKTEKRTKIIMDLITRNTNRMDLLINDLLDFSCLEADQVKLKFDSFPVEVLINEIVQDFGFKAKEKDVSLTTGRIKKDLRIIADREKIGQVIANLLANAMKFTPEKGRVKLECSSDGKDNVLITITDSGRGISAEHQKNIFEKFYQVDGSISRSHSGFGLGLAIVKSIVDQHNGRVWVESKSGKGSKFFVLLPYDTTKKND